MCVCTCVFTSTYMCVQVTPPPDARAKSTDGDVIANAWFGPAGTYGSYSWWSLMAVLIGSACVQALFPTCTMTRTTTCLRKCEVTLSSPRTHIHLLPLNYSDTAYSTMSILVYVCKFAPISLHSHPLGASGCKYVRLYDRHQSHLLYPATGVMCNTSQVHPGVASSIDMSFGKAFDRFHRWTWKVWTCRESFRCLAKRNTRK